ncbi:hypothetical protein FRC12_016345 [Ceratobasidium sp. 428]|nr:hypothetical protein FRC12_016345 [Ceratobasidium sp. 428]
MPRATTQVHEDDFLNDLSDIEERADIPMGSPTRHQSPAPTGENTGNTQDGNRDLGSTNSEAQAPRPNQGALQTGGNLRQTVDQLITSKKLSADAQRELHKYAKVCLFRLVFSASLLTLWFCNRWKASGPECDVMAFASMVELKDDTSKIASAIVDNGIHPALVTNIRLYTAALFFSPDLPQYRTPRTGARSGALQKAVMKAMRISCGAGQNPPANV